MKIRAQTKRVKGKLRWYLVRSYRNDAGKPRTKWLVYLGDRPNYELKKFIERANKHPALKYLFPTAVESIKIYAANLRKKRKLKELQHPAKLERRRHLYASHKTGLPNLRRNDQLSMLRLWRWNVEQAVKQLEADPDFGPVKNWSNLTEARKQVLRLKVAPIMEFVLRVEALLAGKSQSKTLQPAVHLSRASDDEPAEDNTGKLKEMLEVLDEREAAIIRGRYGMDDGTIKTLSELGRKFGITRERVRQLAKKAMQELRAAKL